MSSRKRKQPESGTAGGANLADIAALSSSLGMPADAVSAMLAARGGGGGATRSRRLAPPPAASEPTSSAWDDFLDGAGADDATADGPSASAAPSASGPRPASDDGAAGDVAPTPPVTLACAGVLAQTGTLDSSMPGRKSAKTTDRKCDLEAPTVLCRSLFSGRKIKFVATSSTSCHSMCIDTGGSVYLWGRNDMGQCGVPTEEIAHILVPRRADVAKNFAGTGGATGKSHSVVVGEDGSVWSTGSNKMGQCGVALQAETVKGWKKAVAGNEDGKRRGGDEEDVKFVQAACGEQFSIFLSDEGHLYSAGSSEFGQLGNGETGEHFISANKIGFANSHMLLRRKTFVSPESNEKYPAILPDGHNIRLSHIACGKNHAAAVEAPRADPSAIRRVFSFGCGSYGCLGHGRQTDEHFPKSVAEFESAPSFRSNPPVSVSCGTQHTLIRTGRGHVYYCGKHKTGGEATMRPAVVDALAANGHDVLAVGAGQGTAFCCTKNGNTVSWGVALYGALGYGKSGGKSSSKPKFVAQLDKCIVDQVACGYGHTLFVVRDEDKEDKDAMKNMACVEPEDLKEDEMFINESASSSTSAGKATTEGKKKGRKKK